MMKKNFPNWIIPFLFAWFPTSSFFLSNISHVRLSVLLLSLFMISLVTSGVLFLFLKFLKEENKAIIAASIVLFLTLSYGRFVFFLIENHSISTLIYYDQLYLMVWFLIMFYLIYLVVKTKKKLDLLVFFLKALGAIILIINFTAIIFFLILNISNKKIDFENSTSSDISNPNQPDIYFLVLDRYANSTVLTEYFGFDNSDFEEYLNDKGFYVAKEANANYMKTAHSLTSTLNLNYFPEASLEENKKISTNFEIYRALKNNKVNNFLKEKDYYLYHFGSWWDPTLRNNFADENVNKAALSEYSLIFLKNTSLYPLLSNLNIYDQRIEQRNRIKHQFEKLNEIPDDPKSTFVFAHFLLTHPPYIFDQNGNFFSYQEEYLRGYQKNYTEQLTFTNTLIKNAVENILRKDPNSVIILQSDEGPYPLQYSVNSSLYETVKNSTDALKMKMGILNAIYLPSKNYHQFESNMTPVNTFRMIFNEFFGSGYVILPNKSYIYSEKYPYKIEEVNVPQ